MLIFNIIILFLYILNKLLNLLNHYKRLFPINSIEANYFYELILQINRAVVAYNYGIFKDGCKIVKPVFIYNYKTGNIYTICHSSLSCCKLIHITGQTLTNIRNNNIVYKNYVYSFDPLTYNQIFNAPIYKSVKDINKI